MNRSGCPVLVPQRYVLVAGLFVATAVAAAGPVRTRHPSIVGAWEICGSSPASAEQLDPRGTPGAKALFTARGKRFVQLPDKAMTDTDSLHSLDYTYSGDVLSWKNGDLNPSFKLEQLDEKTIVARGQERTLLYCRLGPDQAAFDRPLQPQSVDYLRTDRQPPDRAIRNPTLAPPPPGTLNGTWELVRVTTRPGPDSLPPYGLPTIRVTIDRDRFCGLRSDFAGEVSVACTQIELNGMRVELAEEKSERTRLVQLFDTGQALELNRYGGLSLRQDRSTYHFAWVGPNTDVRAPFATRLVLFEFIK